MSKILFENEIALVLIVKNESLYIDEWLEYHYRIGVDKFYIYDNESEDQSELNRVLAPWIRAGVVDLETVSGVKRQIPVYNDAIERHRFDCRYMGFIDTDEFIFVKNGKSLLEFFDDHFNAKFGVAGLGINWRMFGTSSRKTYEPLDVIERFTMRAADDFIPNRHIKTIANPRMIAYVETPHHMRYLLDCGCYGEDLNLIEDHQNLNNECKLIQCNHYFTKSEEEFSAKLSRGRADIGIFRSEKEREDLILNEVEDVSLRDFWRRIKLQPLPQPKDRSSQKILANVCDMLQPLLEQNLSKILEGQIEKLLTCFFLIHKSPILNDSERLNLEETTLNLLYKTLTETKINICQTVMVLESRAEILETKLEIAVEIMQVLLNTIPDIIAIAEDSTIRQETFYLKQIQKDLKLILN